MQSLGFDMHIANFILAHMNGRGKLCRLYERLTSVETLVDVLAEIPGPKRMVVVESHMAWSRPGTSR